MRRVTIDRIVVRVSDVSSRDARRIAAAAGTRIREIVADSEASSAQLRGRISAGLARLVKEKRHAR